MGSKCLLHVAVADACDAPRMVSETKAALPKGFAVVAAAPAEVGSVMSYSCDACERGELGRRRRRSQRRRFTGFVDRAALRRVSERGMATRGRLRVARPGATRLRRAAAAAANDPRPGSSIARAAGI